MDSEDDGGDLTGNEGSEDLGDMGGGAPLQEVARSRGLIRGNKNINKDVFEQYEKEVEEQGRLDITPTITLTEFNKIMEA